ncbi:MAG: prepilin-type N-terminal cleavage/methylation domain-containing protein [Candidatus Gracilibacteria bacterium]|jgi:prepilin-type N-terminal cleavage/methylation domain-containing protein|nr:prepilin-type N-terminal cleavage/methylation domain-containing protein [Candidatus Gracilibacteria bacterium]MDD5179020.1 prepilin-type N-terminal cleavage/methylation domain-containing protein [Candidatus Gracilibacteria bacterium]
MQFFSHQLRSKKGFTLVETLVAISIFLTVMGISVSLFTDTIASNRRVEVSRLLYEESRIALERVAKEVRRGTVDYEEYFNRHHFNRNSTADTVYGQNYGNYALQFFRDADNTDAPPDSIAEKNRMDENVGVNYTSAAIGDASSLAVCGVFAVPAVPDSSGYQQCELYLITADGSEKTIIKVVPEDITGGSEYRLEMLKLTGSDTDGDAVIDAWTPLSDFSNYTFQKIQPDSIKITGLKFFISPLEDPRKAFAEFENSIQIQPQITILLTAQPSQMYSRGIKGEIPTITIQTTVTARAQNEVKSLQ